MDYLLMHEDTALMRFALTSDPIHGERAQEIMRYHTSLPYGWTDIDTWLQHRNYAKHKEHLRRMISTWGLDTISGFLHLTHALGLNDSFWVKEMGSDLTWDAVNLYDNEFDDVVEHLAFEHGLGGYTLSGTSPELTSEGSFPKCWVRTEDGTIRLYKAGSEGFANAGLEPYSEYFASQVFQKYFEDQPGAAVPYTLACFHGKLVTSCAMFTSRELGFVPMHAYRPDARTWDASGLLFWFDTIGYGQRFREMLVLDSIVLNTDRHWGNYGFLVDNHTMLPKGFAPIFDLNYAFIPRAYGPDFEDIWGYIEAHGPAIGYDWDIGKRASTPEIRSRLRKLLSFSLDGSGTDFPAARLEILNEIIQRRLRAILG